MRCPTEIDPYLPSIIEIGNKFIKYDPVCFLHLNFFHGTHYFHKNYAGDDDEDEDEEMADPDDDEDEEELDEYVVYINLPVPNFMDSY